MRQQEFQESNAADWDKLDKLLAGSDPGGELPVLFRRLSLHLSVARTRGYGSALLERLNGLALRTHQRLYGARNGGLGKVLTWLARDFPKAVRAESRLVGVTTLLFFGSAFATAFFLKFNPNLFASFVDPGHLSEIGSMYDPASDHFLRPRDADSDFLMFGFYIYNNISIAFRTFAGGIFFGIGSLLILFFNGSFLGCVHAYLDHLGYSDTLWAFAIGHGSVELFAIVLSAAAGLRVGWALVAPGRHKRSAALRLAGVRAMPLVFGATAMLLLAAAIEAFWSARVDVPANIKFLLGGLGWVGVTCFFLFGGRDNEG